MDQEQYICDECGFTSPVANERCPQCNSPISALHEDKQVTPAKAEDGDGFLSAGASDDDAPSSLEALQSKEQEESDKEYQQDTYGNE